MSNRPFTIDETARMIELMDEGMPINWIAEDLNRNKDSVGEKVRRLRLDSTPVEEWRRTWSYIRNHPALLELHREFKPKRCLTTRRTCDLTPTTSSGPGDS